MSKQTFKPFLLTKFALENVTTMFVLFIMIALFGIVSYITLPKEDSPDIEMPYIHISTLYAGVSPEDIENLITKPMEKELKGINEIKKIDSSSFESYSSISLEFQTTISIEDALQKVRDKVSIAKTEFPIDAEESVITEISFEQMPAMIVSLSGPHSLVDLKNLAERLEDDFQTLPQVLETTIIGGLEREIQVNVDREKMSHYDFTFNDIINALNNENLTMPGGKLTIGNSKYLMRIPGEYKSVDEIPYLVVDRKSDRQFLLKEIATVTDGFKEQTSKSRYKTDNSVSIVIKRKSGENLIELSDQVRSILAEFPFSDDITVALIGDQADNIRSMVSELTNSIITGMLLVILVLLFFLGFLNAVFVGIAIPMSMLISFIIVQTLGMTLNMVVLFSLILALGMLVDNGIVIVENIYRHMQEGESPYEAALNGTSEVAWPVIGSTLTTLAAFFPMVFWPGMMGGFMKYLPITLIIALSSSLFVAFCITPVLCKSFMKVKPMTEKKGAILSFYEQLLSSLIEGKVTAYSRVKKVLIQSGLFFGFFFIFNILMTAKASSAIEYNYRLSWWEQLVKIADQYGPSIVLTVLGLGALYVLIKYSQGVDRSKGVIRLLAVVSILLSVPFFDTTSGAIRLVIYSLFIVLFWVFVRQFSTVTSIFWRRSLLVYSFIWLFFGATSAVGSLDTLFFPRITPERIMVQLTMPEGTSLDKTDAVISPVEAFVHSLSDTDATIIKHFVTNLGTKSSNSMGGAQDMSHLAEIQIDFYKMEERALIQEKHNLTDAEVDPYTIIEKLRTFSRSLPGGVFAVIEAEDGPASGKPISLAISGDDFTVLKSLTERVMQAILSVEGLVNLEDNLNLGVPEIRVNIDREKAAFLGVRTFDIANAVRTAVNGVVATTFRDGEDEIDIVVKLQENQYHDTDDLEYLMIPGKDHVRIPLGQVATLESAGGIGAITREDRERIVKIEGDVSQESGLTPQVVKSEVEKRLTQISLPEGYRIEFKGEQEDQEESQAFLSRAFMIALSLIAIILITQFNSVITPFIILISVILSFIGVVWGLFLAPVVFSLTFKPAPFIIIMSGVGIISLAGVVVNNAIVLLDYIIQLRGRGETKDNAIVKAGVVRFRPVVLTAMTTILGLIPMSAGFSFDFLNRIYGVIPRLITSSSSTEWWAPLANAIIFGLFISTMLTLVMVPVLYDILDRNKD